MFNFEKLHVYQHSLQFAQDVLNTSSNWPAKYRFNLTDQLLRASISISLNIAEGSSKSKNDFKRYLAIARGSTYECIPLITLAEQNTLISEKKKDIWYTQLVAIAKMLSKLRNSIS